jgi:phospholipid transport system substrate-binding protein
MTTIRIVGLAVTMLAATCASAQDPSGPVSIVEQTTNRLFEQVESSRETYENDVEQLRSDIRGILLPRIDTMYSGQLVLGRKVRGMDEQKVREFADALSDLLIRRYADGLLEFRTRDQVEVLPLAGDNTERMTRVKTRVMLNNGETAPVDYVFRKTEGSWKIFDVIVEGVSYVATFRNQIGEQIDREGFDATLEKLRSGQIEIDDGQ